MKIWTNVCQKKLVLSHYFAPLFFNKRTNFTILSLFNGGVINISPLCTNVCPIRELFHSQGVFLIIKNIFKPIFSGYKILFHPIYCPWKQVIGYTCHLLWPRFFRLGPYPTHTPQPPLPEKSWPWLRFITEGRYTLHGKIYRVEMYYCRPM